MKMVKKFILVVSVMMSFLFVTSSVMAQNKSSFNMPNLSAPTFPPSKLFPILSSTDIKGLPNGAIETDAILKIHDRCQTKLPDRFPPVALNSYCTCAAAATQGNITVGELRELQNSKTRVLGNKTFEKYVEKVMKPCMEMPIRDIENYLCLSSHKIDWRIKLPVPYCQCSSSKIADHFKKYGLTEMMISWGTKEKIGDETPIDTIWFNNDFLSARRNSKEECVSRYMDSQYFR